MSNASLFQQDYAGRLISVETGPVSIRVRRQRLYMMYIFAAIWVSILIARLFFLQMTDFGKWRDWASKQHTSEINLASERGPILDRSGRLMAVSVPSGSVYVRPKEIKDPNLVVEKLSGMLQIDPAEIKKKLASEKAFVWIQRQIPRVKAEQINSLQIPGLGSFVESRRFYPFNSAASSLIGKVGMDGNGLSGVEAIYEKRLNENKRVVRILKDAKGKVIQDEITRGFELPKGEPLQLAIDAEFQQITDEELERGRQAANAKSAMAVMINTETGEILAMSQAPSINFNEYEIKGKEDLQNKVVESVFEPGSIMKPLVTAAAIDLGLTKAEEKINCENGTYYFAKRTINDVHPHGSLSVRDIVVRSSNIGMTKLGVRFGADRLYQVLTNFGFGRSTQTGLLGETSGILRKPSTWAEVDIATHSFGQGVAVTPLQMVRAISAVANGGKLYELSLLKTNQEPHFERILGEDAALSVKDMMYAVVEDPHGTGAKAAVKGIRVGGKTGTAQKADQQNGGYKSGAYISSFVGFTDSTAVGIDDKFTLLVSIDEPNCGVIYGGALAGPVFSKVISRVVNTLTTRKGLEAKPSANVKDSTLAFYR